MTRSPLFAGFAADELAALAGEGAVLDLAAGDHLFGTGDPAGHIYVIVAGQLELCLDDADGARKVVDVLDAGACLGEDALIRDARHELTARAHGAATVFALPGDRLLARLGERFDLVLLMLAGMSAQLRGLVQEITALKMNSTTERLGAYLLGLAAEAATQATVRLPVDKMVLAHKLGMQPESMSRAFAKLRPYGVRTLGHDRVVLSDLPRLRALCAADPLA